MLSSSQDRPGPRTSLESIVSTYASSLQRYFFRRLRSKADSEDMVQELFLRLVKIPELNRIEQVDAYIYRAAGNILKDRYRKSRTAEAFSTSVAVTHDFETDTVSPEHILERRQALDAALKVLNSLEPQVRYAFVLHRIEGLRQAEVAEKLGLSLSSIKKYIVKADALLIRKLREPETY